MSHYPTDLSNLTGAQLVRVFLDATRIPAVTPLERAEFFDFKACVFATIADRDDNPDAVQAAETARANRDRILAQIEAENGGEVR